jgi:hypothetical protein
MTCRGGGALDDLSDSPNPLGNGAIPDAGDRINGAATVSACGAVLVLFA